MKNESGRRPFVWVCAAAAIVAGSPLFAQNPVPATGDVVGQVAPQGLFSFRAEGVPIRQALVLFARANELNIVLDLDVVGEVTVEFNNLPLDLAMRALLDANGYYFVKDGALIRVRNQETRLFHLDYIQTTRSGQGSSAVQITSGSGSSGGSSGASGGASGGSSEQGSSMTLTANSTINFWGDIDTQLKALLGDSGTVTTNSLSGSVLVTSSHSRVEVVANFLASVAGGVLRQVDLEVQIFELALNDSSQLGINWSWVSDYLYKATFSTLPGVPGPVGGSLSTAGGLIIQRPVFGPALSAPAIHGEYSHRGLQAVVEALQQQGNLKIVSKPRLRTLNNQPAVVRVGQDIPVFLKQVTIAGGNPPIVTETESIQTVTVGTVLSITPQVSADGLITLDITPAISRLVRIDSSGSGNTTAPVIDIRQASSIVRLRDGDTIIMGGLVQESEFSTQRKVPILSGIPFIGRVLFTADAKSKERSELVFFLTPRIVSDAGGN
jgi:MSHA biogenesis protein MshL